MIHQGVSRFICDLCWYGLKFWIKFTISGGQVIAKVAREIGD